MARQTNPLPENNKKKKKKKMKQLPSGRETCLQHLINNWTFKRELAFHCFLLLKNKLQGERFDKHYYLHLAGAGNFITVSAQYDIMEYLQ